MFTIVMITLAILQSTHVIDLAMEIWEILIVLYGFYIVGRIGNLL